MIKRISLILAFGLLLAACTGQAAPPAGKSAVASSSTAAGPTATQPGPTQLTQAAATQAATAVTAAPTTETPVAAATAQPECSKLPLAQSILVLGGYTPAYPNDPRNLLTATDPANGLPACGYASFSFLRPMGQAFSKDRKSLAIVEYRDENYSDGVLHLIDLEAWKVVTTTITLNGQANAIAFDPSGTRLAIAYSGPFTDTNQTYSLLTADLASQKVLARRDLGFIPSLLRYTPDGSGVILFGGTYSAPFGSKPLAHAALLNAQDLKTAWEPALNGVWDGFAQPKTGSGDYIFDSWNPAAVLSPDGEALYVVHSDEDRLTRVDFARRSVSTLPIKPKLSWLERLLGTSVAYAKGQNGVTKQAAFSKDGKRLFVTGILNKTEIDAQGNWLFSQTPLGLQVIDPATGAELDKLDVQGTDIILSPDGSRLVLLGWKDDKSWIDVVSLDPVRLIAHIDGQSISPAWVLNGQTAWLYTAPPSAMVSLVDPLTLPPQGSGQGKKWWMGGYALLPEP